MAEPSPADQPPPPPPPHPPGQQQQQPPQSQSQTAKRTKTRLACQECRDRKVRCDGVRPVCNSCKRKGLGPEHCIYVDLNADVRPEYVKSLEGRIRELEQNLLKQEEGRLSSPLPTPVLADQPAATRPSYFAGSPGVPGKLDLASPNHAIGNEPPIHGIKRKRVESMDPMVHRGFPPEHFQHPAQHLPPPPPQQGAPTPAGGPPTWQSLESQPSQQRRSNSFRGTPPSANNTRFRLRPGSRGGDADDDSATQSASVMGAADGEPGDTNVFLGPSSAAAFMKEVRSSRKRTSDHPGDDAASSTGSRVSRMRTKAEHEDLLKVMDELVLPPKRVADAHISKYWEYNHTLYPIMHRPSFMKRYRDMWHDDNAAAHHDSAHATETAHTLRAFHAVFNIMLALGCTFASPTGITPASRKNAEVFFKRAQKLINKADLDHGTLDLVQAMVLTAQYLQGTGSVNRCWITVGMAIRVAQGMGIQLDLPSESQAEQQQRRRTWWCCVQLDRVFSMTFGRPPMIVWPTVVPMPEPVEDDVLSLEPGSSAQPIAPQAVSITAFFVQALLLTKILMEVLRQMYSPTAESRSRERGAFPTTDCTLVLEIDEQMGSWRAGLPGYLVYGPNMDTVKREFIFQRQATTLYCRYLHLRILLFRPTTVILAKSAVFDPARNAEFSAFQRMTARACVSACVLAAQELIRILWTETNSGRLGPWWYSVFYLYTAGTVVLSMFMAPEIQAAPLELLDSLENSWNQCIEALRYYADSDSAFAKRCLWTLQTAHVQGMSEMNSQHTIEDQIAGGNAGGAPRVDANGPARMLGPDEAVPNPNDPYGFHDPAITNLGEGVLMDPWWPAGNLDWLGSIPSEMDAPGDLYDTRDPRMP